MNNEKLPRTRIAVTLIVVAAFTASCSPGSGPSSSGLGVQQQSQHGARPSVFVSTTVKFKNAGTTTISGSGSDTCWSIMPSLPSLMGGDLSSIITLGYSTTCIGGSNHLSITYGPPSGPDCTFKTTYSGGAFSYEADNSPLTACSAAGSGNQTFDELYTYAPAPLKRHH
jgi:hypothetical protein